MTIDNAQNYQILKELQKELKYNVEILGSKKNLSPSEIIHLHMRIKELIEEINNKTRKS